MPGCMPDGEGEGKGRGRRGEVTDCALSGRGGAGKINVFNHLPVASGVQGSFSCDQ